MRILIVFHGWFPTPGRPVAGGALRAWHHAEALREAGHDVHLVTRRQDAVPDGPPTFASTPELVEHARRVRPDVLLVVQPEEAPGLACLELPMVVDLYAPRILEAQFQDAAGLEAVNTLRAIRAGDFFLFSNHRQRFYFLGLLALAGVDLRSHAFGAVVPLVAPQGPERKKPRGPLFVMGGVSWPWIDPTEALGRAVAHLDKRRRGKLLVLGHRPILGESPVRDLQAELPASKRLEFGGVLPYDQLLATYAGASAAIDMMAPTPERSMAVAFRHMDYLGCGLPMIVGDEHVLAEPLRDAGAGLVGLSVEEAIDTVMDDPDALAQRSQAARSLATGRFGRAGCEAPLLAWLQAPTRRERRDTPLGELAEVSARAARSELLERTAQADIVRLTAEVEAKRGEVAGLVQQSRVLSVATERLAGSVAEIAGFKREAIAVLGGAQAQAREELGAQQAHSAALEADVAKKGSELEAALREKGLQQGRMQDLRAQLVGAAARVQALRTARDVANEAREAAQADALKKTVELDAQARQAQLLGDQVASLQSRLEAADKTAAEVAASELREVGLLQTIDVLRARSVAETGALLDARADSAKKSAEFEGMQLALDQLRSRSAANRTALGDTRADAAKKGAELESLQQALAQELRAAEAVQGELVELRTHSFRSGAEHGVAQQLLDRARGEVAALRQSVADSAADAAAKGALLAALQQECEKFEGSAAAAQGRYESQQDKLQQQAAEIACAEQARGAARAQVESLEASLADAQVDIEKKNNELEDAWSERERLEGLISELRSRR